MTTDAQASLIGVEQAGQRLIDASPFSLTQLIIGLVAAALTYAWMQSRKGGKHAGLRAKVKRVRRDERYIVEGQATAKALARAAAEAGAEVTKAHRSLRMRLDAKAAEAGAASEEVMTEYGQVMDGDLHRAAALCLVVGVVLGWDGGNWQATAISGMAGAIGSVCSKGFHALGKSAWPWIRSKLPGYKDPPDDPPPLDRSGLRNVSPTETMV